jgi:hypothetical protein
MQSTTPLEAARKMGWNTVPTIKLSHLTESQRMAFLIADQRRKDEIHQQMYTIP